MSVHVQKPGLNDPLALDLGGEKFLAWIALPQHGAFAGLLVHQDKGGLALAVRDNDPVRLNSGSAPLVLLEEPRRVVADLSDITRLQAPSSASSDGRGNLAARENFRNAEFHLGIER